MAKEMVLITGASSGFGYLAALELAKSNYFVIATIRNLTNKRLLLDQAEKMGIRENIEILQLDVTNQVQIEEVKNYVLRAYGTIDILINNAGYSVGGMTEQLDLEQWRAQLETNLFGVIAVVQAFLPAMREKRKGKIINLGSISGRFGFPGLGAYATSKFALSGFSESLRLELVPFHIHVSLIEAGSYKTRIWEKALANVPYTGKDDYNEYMRNIYQSAEKTAQKAGDPSEVIDTILQICTSPKPKFRYQVGKGVKMMILLKNILPWPVIEWIIKRKLFRN
jgi:NAD(P)-dependent dehydrogenase (short-subunit alcohol dehydrogenase family)